MTPEREVGGGVARRDPGAGSGHRVGERGVRWMGTARGIVAAVGGVANGLSIDRARGEPR